MFPSVGIKLFTCPCWLAIYISFSQRALLSLHGVSCIGNAITNYDSIFDGARRLIMRRTWRECRAEMDRDRLSLWKSTRELSHFPTQIYMIHRYLDEHHRVLSTPHLSPLMKLFKSNRIYHISSPPHHAVIELARQHSSAISHSNFCRRSQATDSKRDTWISLPIDATSFECILARGLVLAVGMRRRLRWWFHARPTFCVHRLMMR
jgi:hypothetical protein